MHPLAVEATVHAHQRPKLERYDDTLFLVLKNVQKCHTNRWHRHERSWKRAAACCRTTWVVKRPYAKQIRREQSVVLSADRSPKVAGIGAPISGADGTIIAALTCSMPTERLDKSFEPFVKKAARDLTTLIGHSYPEPEK